MKGKKKKKNLIPLSTTCIAIGLRDVEGHISGKQVWVVLGDL